MTEEVIIRLPKLGESIQNATVVQWMKKEGDLVQEDEPLVEVATDKVNSEIPSPAVGVLKKILASPDELVDIGAPLAQLQPLGDVDLEAEANAEPEYHSALEEEHHEASKGFLSPAVLRLVRERGVPLEELDHISGSGQGGRITKKDVENYLMARSPAASTAEVERVPISPMRRAIADNMVRSFYEAPHAYLVTEVDVTLLAKAISEHKEAFLKKYGAKLTITSFVMHALCQAIQQFPLINASMEEEHILVKKHVNVGVAVAVDQGLVVPVLKCSEQKTIPEIAQGVADLSVRARKRKLKPDDVMDGSITLTNFGMSGALIGLPIIRHPEVAILGIGAMQKRVAVFDNDSFGVRQTLHATLSFDHRAVDGMYAGGFIKAFEEALEGQYQNEVFTA